MQWHSCSLFSISAWVMVILKRSPSHKRDRKKLFLKVGATTCPGAQVWGRAAKEALSCLNHPCLLCISSGSGALQVPSYLVSTITQLTGIIGYFLFMDENSSVQREAAWPTGLASQSSKVVMCSPPTSLCVDSVVVLLIYKSLGNKTERYLNSHFHSGDKRLESAGCTL